METTKTIKIFEGNEVKNKFEAILWKRTWVFMTALISIIKWNSMLKNADPQSIYDSAMTAVALDLPINQNLGMAFIVPYKTRDDWIKASFQIWYKWLKQLALRSWQIAKMADVAVKEWQLIENDPLTWPTFSRSSKISEKIIGYVFYVKLLDWYEKALYMTIDELKAHGKKYSKSFDKGNRTTDFDSMARKTVIRLLLTSWDIPLSIDVRNALSEEYIKPNAKFDDKKPEVINPEDTTEDDLYEELKPKAMEYKDYVDYLLSFLPDDYIQEWFEWWPYEDQKDDYVKALQIEIGRRCIKDRTIILEKDDIKNIFIGEDKAIVAMKKEALQLLPKETWTK